MSGAPGSRCARTRNRSARRASLDRARDRVPSGLQRLAALSALAIAPLAPAQEEPEGCNSPSIGASLVATVGGEAVPPGACVIPGQEIRYFAGLFVSPNLPPFAYCDAFGGELSVTLPDWHHAKAVLVEVAGYPGTPAIPQFGNPEGAGASFSVEVGQVYVADPADADANGFLNARVDYGQTSFLSGRGIQQAPAVVLTDPPQPGNAATSSSLRMCLPQLDVVQETSIAQVCDGVEAQVVTTVTVTNTGEVDLLSLTVVGSLCQPRYQSGDANGDRHFNPGETWTYACTATILTTTTSTVTASAVAVAFNGEVVLDVEYTDTSTITIMGKDCFGACCLPDGSCAETTQEDCAGQGGDFKGDEIDCEAASCVQPKGACCFDSGACAVIRPDQCAKHGGDFQGHGTVCMLGQCPPPKGACCFGNGSCSVQTQDDCHMLGGNYQGAHTVCLIGLCPLSPGACCLPNGVCVQATQSNCNAAGGQYQGDGSPCGPGLCAQQGACCLDNGLCLPASEEACDAAGGLFQGEGSDCERVDCGLDGACCLPGGACAALSESACAARGGLFQGEGTSCAAVVCQAESCCEFGKPRQLVMLHTGDDCSATMHAQDRDKVDCDDFAPLPGTAYIVASDRDDPADGGARIWFSGTVHVGEPYVLDAANANQSKFKSNTFIHVLDRPGGQMLQQIRFHTSCSQPLRSGDQFGSALLLDCVGEDEPLKGELCADGIKPQVLVMAFTGDDCDATSHGQDPSKVDCDDFGPIPMLVRVRASDESDPDDDDALVWFDGLVALGEQLDVDATAAGQSRLKSETFVHVFDLDGALLQSIRFHTSCSQPLFVDDQFGSLRVVDLIPE